MDFFSLSRFWRLDLLHGSHWLASVSWDHLLFGVDWLGPLDIFPHFIYGRESLDVIFQIVVTDHALADWLLKFRQDTRWLLGAVKLDVLRLVVDPHGPVTIPVRRCQNLRKHLRWSHRRIVIALRLKSERIFLSCSLVFSDRVLVFSHDIVHRGPRVGRQAWGVVNHLLLFQLKTIVELVFGWVGERSLHVGGGANFLLFLGELVPLLM